MPPTKLHELYAERMLARHDLGWAFYSPPSSTQVYPGMAGYIDAQGLWNPMIDLCADSQAFEKIGLKQPATLPDRAPNDHTIEWGPKLTDHVTAKRLDLKAGFEGLGLGLPIGISCVLQLSSSSDNGAVLLTEPNIWREGSFYHSHEFEIWVKQNSEAILKARPEVKEHGLWVVKWTYTTKKCSINAWMGKSQAVTVGFATNIVPVGEIGPKGEWSESTTDSGWAHFTAKDDTERRVVFMGGLFFRFRRLAPTGKHLHPESPMKPAWVFRSGNETAVTKVIVDEEEYEILTEQVGTLDVKLETEDDEAEDIF